MISARAALKKLRDGNHRFVSGTPSNDGRPSRALRNELAKGQHPFAIILGCSDSRVPAEIVFDQGLGDLFVIRVAGNIVAPSQVGSVEFAAVQFGVRLVVVLGHSQCGAVIAALDELRNPQDAYSKDPYHVVNRIKPAVEPLLEVDTGQDQEALTVEAVRANIRASVGQLRSGSETLDELIRSEGLLVVGAEYSLETGTVEFFDGVEEHIRVDS
jgi:carbonic anhydrase